MNTLSLIESLEAVGVPAEKILLALKEAYARDREAGRQRTIKSRNNNRRVTDVTDVTLQALQTPSHIENARAPDSLFLPSEVIKKEKKVSKITASRFQLDAILAPEWHAFCVEKRPDLDPNETFESFRDWWVAQPGQKGLKLDWFATWRTWVRRQAAIKPNISTFEADLAAQNERMMKKYAQPK